MTRRTLLFVALCSACLSLMAPGAYSADPPSGIKIATFDVDATPPVGAMMAYNPVRRVDELTLRCRGIILIGAGEPIVLCALDWIGLYNEGHDAFRETLATAVGTTPQRVSVHCLHQHDAPACDFSAERLLVEAGHQNIGRYESAFARELLRRLSTAVKAAMPAARPITHYGYGAAEVEGVASNRRILGPDGKVRVTRYTATADPAVRAEPVGTIDPVVSLLSFWDGDQPVACLTYYACHPQSYYRTGIPSPDFPGIARFIRGQELNETLHVHFNGAGGNIGAGKYNDGAHKNRLILATRLADGMQRAFENTTKAPLTASAVAWQTEPVSLPLAKYLDKDKLAEQVKNFNVNQNFGAPEELAFVQRTLSSRKIDLGCLSVGDVRVVHMPGELFIEYQLAAKAMRPDLKVMMAAYGDNGPGYIGTEIAYTQGGYEVEPRSSLTAPEVETVLMNGMKKLLGAK